MNNTASADIEIIAGLSALAGTIDVILCDIWGVLHNGVKGYEAASDALTRFRQGGGRVILVSNAPRPNIDIVSILDRNSAIGMGRDCHVGRYYARYTDPVRLEEIFLAWPRTR